MIFVGAIKVAFDIDLVNLWNLILSALEIEPIETPSKNVTFQ